MCATVYSDICIFLFKSGCWMSLAGSGAFHAGMVFRLQISLVELVEGVISLLSLTTDVFEIYY